MARLSYPIMLLLGMTRFPPPLQRLRMLALHAFWLARWLFLDFSDWSKRNRFWFQFCSYTPLPASLVLFPYCVRQETNEKWTFCLPGIVRRISMKNAPGIRSFWTIIRSTIWNVPEVIKKNKTKLCLKLYRIGNNFEKANYQPVFLFNNSSWRRRCSVT